MWRPLLSVIRRRGSPLNSVSKAYSSGQSKQPPSLGKVTLVSASVGVLLGAGYGGYTHYKVNIKGAQKVEDTDYAFLKTLPDYKPTFRVINENDTSNLQLVLFQYKTCPFCCKVRTYLDYHGISYEIVEVDAVLRQDIKWSGYKKVPILLAKVEGGYQQLLDSSMIVSVLETYLRDKMENVRELVKWYPVTSYVNDDGKKITEVMNKYFIMHKDSVPDKIKKAEEEERKWRLWADGHLVHLLSPNVYRNVNEAYQAFNWFAEAGKWWENFPAWECYLMVNVGAAAMWIISKRLKKRHNIQDDVRSALYDAANEWVNCLKEKGTKFLGGNEPNLGDLSVFGVLTSIEGCDAFVDLRKNTEIGKWYDDMREIIDTRKGKEIKVKKAS